jgi:hypothetical protein
LTQVLSPIEEENNEDNVDRERDIVVDALFPSGSEDDFSGSQQSIELKVDLSTCSYVIFFFSVDLLYVEI